MAQLQDAEERLRELKIARATGSGKFSRAAMAKAEAAVRAKKEEQSMLEKVNQDLGVQVKDQSIKVNPDGHVAKPGEHTGPGFSNNPFQMSKRSPLGKLFGIGSKKASTGQKIASGILGGEGASSLLGGFTGAESGTGGLVSGAVSGFSMGGPVGALIGGGLGALVGSSKAKAKRAEEERKAAREVAMRRSEIEENKGQRLQNALHSMQTQFGATLNNIG